MPFWLFAAELGAFLAVSIAAGLGSLWVTARLVKARPGALRLLAAWVALLLLGVGTALPDLLGLAPHPGLDVALALLWLTAYVTIIKVPLRLRWLRTLAACALHGVISLVAALALTAAVNATVFKSFRVPTAGMAPTINAGERFLVDRLSTPRRWDPIVFEAPADPGVLYIQRLVGLPGETIEIVGGEVTVNGRVVPRPRDLAWIAYGGQPLHDLPCRGGTGSPITLGPDEHYVLGDNTTASMDSRYWPPPAGGGTQQGTLHTRAIIGIARAVYAPVGKARVLDASDRTAP
ncbi:MAG: signal peptidase I [Phycisphaerales bacterium]